MKLQRRWLRLSMRSLLALMAISAIAFGWISHRARQQRQIVEWIQDHGGNVTYENERSLKANGVWQALHPDEQPAWKWIPLPREWKSEGLQDYEWDIVYVELQSTSITDLSPISRLSKLERLGLSEARLEDVSPLRRLTNLKVVYLDLNSLSPSPDLVVRLRSVIPKECAILGRSHHFQVLLQPPPDTSGGSASR